jgi:hypothetical protein
MMEAVRTAETSVDNHFTRQYLPEDNSEYPSNIWRKIQDRAHRNIFILLSFLPLLGPYNCISTLSSNTVNPHCYHNDRNQVSHPYIIRGSWGSSVNIVSDYKLEIGVQSPTEKIDFSCSLYVQTSSEAHPASCKMGTGGHFPEVKRGRGVTLTIHPI